MTTRHVFLDRDGVINPFVEYAGELDSPRYVDHFSFYEGALQAIVDLSLRASIHVVTNQPGIAYGKITDEEAVRQIHRKMRSEVERAGGLINSIDVCFHSEKIDRMPTIELQKRYYHPSHPFRKPNPGMLLQAKERFAIDMRQAVMVGDRASDLIAGDQAGCGTLILVRNPMYENEEYPGAVICDSLQDVAEYVREQLV